MQSFDSDWERRYAEDTSYRNWYPWSEVVTFVFRYAPRDRARKDISILEIGSGTGNNLWFVAREGFRAAGIEGSKTAVEFAEERFRKDKLSADFKVGDFAKVDFPDNTFDLVFDRGSLTLTHAQGADEAIREVRRVLKPGGVFQCGPFSDRDSSFYRTPDEDGAVRGISVGTILTRQARFYSLQDMRDLFADGWTFKSLQHIEETDMLSPTRTVHSRWLAIVQATD